MVNALGDLMTVLSEADPADKAEVYQQLGLTLTYDPAAKRVKAEAASACAWKSAPVIRYGTTQVPEPEASAAAAAKSARPASGSAASRQTLTWPRSAQPGANRLATSSRSSRRWPASSNRPRRYSATARRHSAWAEAGSASAAACAALRASSK